MLITPSFKKSLVVENLQGNYLKHVNNKEPLKLTIKSNYNKRTIGYIINTNDFCMYLMRMSKTDPCVFNMQVLHAYFEPNIFDLYCISGSI